MKMFFCICLTIFVGAGLAPALAQAGQGKWRTYTAADGLAGPGVKVIFQDSKGYLWFGTCDGISQFDGEHFENFTEAEGLPFNCTTQILEDPRGDIWFLNERFVSHYDGNTLQRITEKDGLAGGYSEAMFLDSKGNLWFANENGATKYDGMKFQTLGASMLKGKIQTIFEDNQGHLWFAGTFIFRYDEKTFHQVEIKFRDMETKLSERALIRVIEEDSVGNLWFAGDAVFMKFDGKNFESFSDKPNKDGSIEFPTAFLGVGTSMSMLHMLPEGSDWYETKGGGRASHAGAGRQHSEPRFFGRTFAILTESIFKDRRGNLWFNDSGFVAKWNGRELRCFFMADNWNEIQALIPEHAYNEKLGYFDPNLFKYPSRSQPGKELALRKGGILPGKVVMEDQNGNIRLLGKRDLYFYDGTRVETLLSLDGVLENPIISAFFEDREGNLWFGHDNGVTRYNPHMSFHNIHPEESLGSSDILALFEDSQGNVWFGVQSGNGIARYDGKKLHYFSDEDLGLSEKQQISIRTFLEDRNRKGNLWIFGNSTDSLFYHDGKHFRNIPLIPGFYAGDVFHPTVDTQGNLWLVTRSLVKIHPRPKEGIQVEVIDNSDIRIDYFGQVSATHLDRHGNIWLAIPPRKNFPSGRVVRYDGKETKVFKKEDGLSDEKVMDIFEDKEGAIWFASYPGSVYRYDYDGDKFQHFRVKALSGSEFPENFVAIRQDAKGYLWFIYGGTDYKGEHVVGIGRYDGKRFESLKAEESLAERLKVSSIHDTLIDRAGRLWLATNRGAIRYDGKQFTTYGRKDGFPVYDLRDILEDSKGHLWFATSGGGIVVTDGETFQSLFTLDGLVDDRVSQILEDRQGQFWFATAAGLSRYASLAQHFPPSIHIRRVIVDEVYTDAKNIRVPASVKHIHIDYRGVSFKSRRLRYRYKLEGYDKDWKTTWRTECDYFKLPPGNYTFKVIAVNQDLVASEAPAQVKLTVLSPFYKQLGFIVPTSTGTLLVLMLLFSQWHAIARLTKQLVSTEEKVRQRTVELQQAQAQLIQAEKLATVGTLAGGVAHEINNPLDAILGSVQRILRLSADPKVVESAQSAQEGTRRCKEIVEKLLKYSRQSRDELTSLEVNQVVEDTVALLEHQLKLENISLNMQLSPGLKVQGNFNELSQVITNLLTNARDAVVEARATGKDAGVITVRTAVEKDAALIKVADNGIGIEAQHLGKLFDPFFTTKPVGKGTGLGLSICQGIVEKHHGRIEVSSKVGDGATFQVFLPLAKNYQFTIPSEAEGYGIGNEHRH